MKRRSSSFAPRLHAVLVAAASWLVAITCWAQAERPALVLRWSAPSDCPQQPRARQLVAEYLGERALSAPASAQRVLQAQATIHKRAQRWELRLITSLDGQPGERTLSASTCADVADAAALVLAFAIDPGAALRYAPNPAPTKPTPPMVESPPLAPARPRTWFGVAASVRGDYGALPGVTGGAALSLSLQHGGWGGMLVGSVFAERAAPSVAKPSAGGEFSFWSLAAAPCWLPLRDTWRLRACLPFELQRLTATGYGIDVPGEATRTELLLGAELAPGLAVNGRLELIVPLGLGMALRRPEFYLEGIGSVFRASVLQARGGLGLLARF